MSALPLGSASAGSAASPGASSRPAVVVVVTPATAPPMSAATPKAAAPARARPRRGGSALRARLAQDRAAQGQRRQQLLRRRLAPVLVAVALLAVGAWFARVPALRHLAERRDAVGSWALEHLVELRDPGSFALYVERFLSDTETYHHVVFQVGGRSDAPAPGEAPPPDDPDAIAEHRAVLLEALASDRREVRAGGLRALFALRERAWTRDPALVERAAGFLDLGPGPAVTPPEQARERRFAALVLRELAPVAPRAALREAALRDPDRQVRKFAVQALGRTGDAAEQPALEAALRDSAPEVVRAANLGLAEVGAEVPFDLLIDLLESDPRGMRAEVVRALEGRPEAEASRLLLEALSDPAPSSRLAAVEVLAGRDEQGAREGLERALRDEAPSVRLAAAEALAERADGSKAAPALLEALEQHQGWWELRALHRALRRVTTLDVRDPVESEPASWQRVVSAWRQRLAGDER